MVSKPLPGSGLTPGGAERRRAGRRPGARSPAPLRRIAPQLASVLAVAVVAGCGKKGPPLPPLGHRPEPVAAVAARQVGADLVLSFVLPTRFTDGKPLEGRPAVTVVRRPRLGSPLVVRRFEPQETAADPGSAVRLAVPMEAVFQATSAPTATLTVEVEAARGKPSLPSAPIAVPRGDAPPTPEGLQLEQGEIGVLLSWSPGATSPQDAVYDVYRRAAGTSDWGAPLNPKPLRKPRFTDPSAKVGAAYEYRVEAVLPAGKLPRASVPTAPVAIVRRDIAPPAPPGEVRAVAEAGGIRLFWFPPEAADLAGFRLYRAREGEAKEHLADLEASASSYLDTQVSPGVSYTYTLTAIDSASPPNESAASEAATERAAPSAPQTAPAPSSGGGG